MPRKQVARLRPKQSRAETANSVRVPRARLSPVLLFLRSLANLFAATSPYLPVKAIKPLPLARFGLFAYWRRQHAHPPWRLSPPILSDPIRRSVEAGELCLLTPQSRFYRTLPNNVSLSQKPRGFASSRRASLRPHARCVRCRSPEVSSGHTRRLASEKLMPCIRSYPSGSEDSGPCRYGRPRVMR